MSEGIERIKVLASETKDKAVLKIVNYLVTRNDMNEKYLNEEKSLKQMIDFIKSQAKKKCENGIAMIEDEVVYGWAIHYWDESNESLKLVKELNEDNTAVDKMNKLGPKKSKTNSKNWIPEGQLSLFDI